MLHLATHPLIDDRVNIQINKFCPHFLVFIGLDNHLMVTNFDLHHCPICKHVLAHAE